MKLSQRLPKQNAELHRLLSLLGMTGVKEELAIAYSNGRTSHTSELSIQECDELIARLRLLDKEKHDASRKSIRHHLQLLGWSGERIEGFIKNIGANNPKKKSLNNLGGQELNRIVSQVKALYRKETVK